MAQAHGDRLTAIDASFLHQEGPNSHMHVGAVMIFDGPPPSYKDYCDHIRARLQSVPRYRQKLAFPPLDAGRPVWIDDPNFKLEDHILKAVLPRPGSEKKLVALAAEIHSEPLDRSKPLWETWLVKGLPSNRFALISKSHHALVDGISGVDLMTVLFDKKPDQQAKPVPVRKWTAQPEPSASDLFIAGFRDLVSTPVKLASFALKAATQLNRTARSAGEVLEGLSEVIWAGLNPSPPTPLNVEIGPQRRLAFVSHSLDAFKSVKNNFGGTVNDVVLAVTSGALRKWLISRGISCEGLELRALVPVSIRRQNEHGQLGNRIVAMRGPLPVYIEDPIARLREVTKAMKGIKQSKQAIGAEVIANMQSFAPPTVLAQASRLNFSTRFFNLLVTNVPGPQFPLYVLGRKLKEVLPLAFLPRNQALSVAIMSYDGAISFGLLGDHDAMSDLDEFADYLEDSIEELVVASSNNREQTSHLQTSSPESMVE